MLRRLVRRLLMGLLRLGLRLSRNIRGRLLLMLRRLVRRLLMG